MLYPIIDPADTRARYNERLQEAEQHRRIVRLERNNPGFFARTAAFITGLYATFSAETAPATAGNTAV